MICTIVRAYLSPEEVAHYDSQVDRDDDPNKDREFENKEIVISLPEKEVRISKREFQYYAPYHENEQIMRLLTGQIKDTQSNVIDMLNSQTLNDQINKNMANDINTQYLMQNLLNNPFLNNLSGSLGSQSQGNGNLNMSMQNQYSTQLLNSLMQNTMPNGNFGLPTLPSGSQNYSNLNSQSLNDLIQSQMMNFNQKQ